MHVYLDKHRDARNCSYIRLDKPEYSTHHGDECKKLNKKQKKIFKSYDRFMEETVY